MTPAGGLRGWLIAVAITTAVVGRASNVHADVDAIDCARDFWRNSDRISQLIEDGQVQITGAIPHDRNSFVEGLFIKEGFVYESQGLNGQSKVKKWILDPTGTIIYEPAMPQAPRGASSYFGEGLAYYGDRLYQLTYKAHLVLVYNFSTFVNTGELDIIANHSYGGQGWGLSTLHNELVMSNGDDHIVFRNPYTFAETRRITVHQGAETVTNINELEVVGDKILANIWYDERLLVINPADGSIEHVINIGPTLRAYEPIIRCTGDNTLNGIAWDPENRELWLTGKLWPTMFKVSLTGRNGAPLLDTATPPAPTPAPTPAPAPAPPPTPPPTPQPTPPLLCDSKLDRLACCETHDRTGMPVCMWNESIGDPACRVQQVRVLQFNAGCSPEEISGDRDPSPADLQSDTEPDCSDQTDEEGCEALASCRWDPHNEDIGNDGSQVCRVLMCEDLGSREVCDSHTAGGAAICAWNARTDQCGFSDQPDGGGDYLDGSNGEEHDANGDPGGGNSDPVDGSGDGGGGAECGIYSRADCTDEGIADGCVWNQVQNACECPGCSASPKSTSPAAPASIDGPDGSSSQQPEATSVAPMAAVGTPSPSPQQPEVTSVAPMAAVSTRPPTPRATVRGGTAAPDDTTRRHHRRSTLRPHRPTTPVADDDSDSRRPRRTTRRTRTPIVPDESHQGDTLTDPSSQDAADASSASTALGVIGALVIILFAAIIFVRRRAKYTLLGDGNLLSEEYNHYEAGDGDSIYNNPAYLNTHEMDGSDEDEEDLVWKTGTKGRF